jgi:hypothetical protein
MDYNPEKLVDHSPNGKTIESKLATFHLVALRPSNMAGKSPKHP